MLLILTHEKADFDAIASQLGAYKLFPAGIPLLPRHTNRNVQQFLNLYWDVLPFMRPDDWRRRRVDKVILVDTQNLNSVRGMVRNPQVRVIDHHIGHEPRPGWTYQVEAVGATTTLLVEMLQANGLLLTPEEATLLLLGVYEDTGSLTYDTATARDVRAAAWLFEQGAQLDVVRRFLMIPLTSAQQALYADLQANVQWSKVQGRAIAVTTAVAPRGFNDEISSIAHRLRETLTPAGLFVLVQVGNDVQLVARSSHASVDVSLVAKALGGGGHSRAAAALVVGSTVTAVAEKVTALLPKAVKPLVRVAEIMSYGVQTITTEQTIAAAARQMLRTGHEGYPVVEVANGRIQGLLTRNAVDRAMNHEMGHLPVSRIMKVGSITVRPSESIERVQELMLREGWGQIPVVADMDDAEGIGSDPIGIVTRTDLLNYWFQPVTETAESDMRALLEASLQPEMWALVQAVSTAAAELQMPLYFVGGLVRDVLLGKSSIDLDMVVEGDAILLVRNLQMRFGGEVHTHSRFGTGKWFVTPQIWAAVTAQYGTDQPSQQPAQSKNNHIQPLPASIDFVTARSEFYAAPSALPEVERGSIKLDLHRRDFTINTLAVRLDGAHLGELLDFYGGQRDLERRLIRVLHSLSFIDDPTRVLRAIRLEQRLGFTIEPRTAELLENALPMLKRVTGERIRHEIELALREADPILVMERFADLGVMAQIYPGLTWTPSMAAAFERVPQLLADPVWQGALAPESNEFLFFALWLASLPLAVQEGTVERLKGRKSTRDDVLAVGELLRVLADMQTDIRPSVAAQLLRPFPPRVLLAARIHIAENQFKAQLLDKFYGEWRHVKTYLSGNDFRLMGFKPGPLYSIWLERLLAAHLDGEIDDEAGERLLLAELVQANNA